MTKQMPKAMQQKVNRMSKLMSQLIDLNQELERWLEDSGITTDGFDYTYDHREHPGYWIVDADAFIAEVNSDLAKEA